MSDWDFDYVVIGAGFGGSVAALRLAEKGYSVAVIERGRRWPSEQFPPTNWNLRKFLWAPALRCFGIQAITILRDVMALHGCGVGGGSLVYGGVLLVPPDEVFHAAPWGTLGDWQQDLAPHYATALRMLGVTTADCQTEMDHMLRAIAEDLGRGETWHRLPVGIYFGTPGETAADPFFQGQGPDRVGCTQCGGCLSGCRQGAKNSLDKNYLHLAEARGVKIVSETEVRDIRPLAGGGYAIEAVRLTGGLWGRRRTFRARGVVAAGGVLGTVPLLLRCKRRGSLPAISERLGDVVRTNSDALVGAISRRHDVDYSQGIAIASGFSPDAETNIELVRYGAGQDFMSSLCTLLVGGGTPWPRPVRFAAEILRRPGRFLRTRNPFGWARRTGILLVMQSVPNHLRLTLRRRWFWPFTPRLDSDWYSTEKVPKYLPVANDMAQRLADRMQGDPASSLPEVLLGLTSTAHVLGGCTMGRDASEGVVDRYGRLFHYDNFYVADGSVVSANLRVNPSLTITALGEWIMSHVPPKESSGKP